MLITNERAASMSNLQKKTLHYTSFYTQRFFAPAACSTVQCDPWIASIPVCDAVSCRDHPLSRNYGASTEMLFSSFQGNLFHIKTC